MCFVALHWLTNEVIGVGFITSVIGITVGLVMLLELTRYFWDDPFSLLSIYKYFLYLYREMKKLLKAIGIGPQTTFIDLSYSDDVIRLAKYLELKAWNEADHFLKELSADERYRVVDALTDKKGRASVYDEWIQQCPHSVLAHIVSGNQYIHWAWEARGDGTADTVSNMGIQNFYQRLNEAHESFHRAVELENKYSDSYIGLMTVAMGTGFEREKLWDYFLKHCFIVNIVILLTVK